jgi:hypothetical protein
MNKQIVALLLALTLSGCSMLGGFKSLEPKNAVKTAATTAVTYAIAGPLPAVLNLATSVAVDEVMPSDEPAISDIEAGNKEQLTAFIIANLTNTILYAFIGGLAFLFVIAPWAADRRAKRKMQDQYRKKKYDDMKVELNVRRQGGKDSD